MLEDSDSWSEIEITGSSTPANAARTTLSSIHALELPSTPSQEQRQRRSLLVQQQKHHHKTAARIMSNANQHQQHGGNSVSTSSSFRMNGGSNNDNYTNGKASRGSATSNVSSASTADTLKLPNMKMAAMEIEADNGSPLHRTSITSSTGSSHRESGSSLYKNLTRKPPAWLINSNYASQSQSSQKSRGLRRFWTILGTAALFCVMIVVREKAQDLQLRDSVTSKDDPPASDKGTGNQNTNIGSNPPKSSLSSLSSSSGKIKTIPPVPTGGNPMQYLGTTTARSTNYPRTPVLGGGDGDSARNPRNINHNSNGHSIKSPTGFGQDNNNLPPLSGGDHDQQWQSNEQHEQQHQKQQEFDQHIQQQAQASVMNLTFPHVPLDHSNNNSFVRKYCDLQGADWYPVEDTNTPVNANNASSEKPQPSWKQRAPFVLFPGPSFAGSHSLLQLLATHPQVADAMNSQFFTFNSKSFVVPTPASAMSKNDTLPHVTIKARAARQAYWARHARTKRQLQREHATILIDSVPETLLYSHTHAPFVLCTMPWVKMVMVLNHPLQRLLDHYQHATSKQVGLTLSLEDWITRDIERMEEAGLLIREPEPNSNNGANNDPSSKTTTTATRLVPGHNHDAWAKYQELTTHSMESSIGQSLYEYMVHPWFTWMEQMGRDPRTEIVVVQQEMLFRGAKTKLNIRSLAQQYRTLIKWLGLSPHTPPLSMLQQVQSEYVHNRRDLDRMDQTVRRHLQRFFAPYNDRLNQFLQEYYQHDDDNHSTNSAAIRNATKSSSQLNFLWDPSLWQ